MQFNRREFRIAGLMALAALGVCQVGQGADDRGSLLERIRTSRTIGETNSSTGASFFSNRRAQVTPIGMPKSGQATVQPQTVMSFGPADIITGAENSLKKQLDPNAGNTLGKRKKKPGNTTSSSSGLSVGSKFEPGAASSRASTDVIAPPTLGKRKKKLNNGGNTTTPSTGGGASQTIPAPQNPAPQNPAPPNPTQPAPTGDVGFPWQDVVGTVIPYVVNRTPVYESPVFVTSPAPMVEEVIVDEPVTAEIVQTPKAAGADLVLEDMKLAAPATILAGPAYEVTFRNQSQRAVGAFRVTVVVGLNDKFAKDAPKAVLDIAGLDAGEVGKATLRLPLVAMKMIAAGMDEPTAFSHIAVTVDSENSVRELDETNNRAVIERAALEKAEE